MKRPGTHKVRNKVLAAVLGSSLTALIIAGLLLLAYDAGFYERMGSDLPMVAIVIVLAAAASIPYSAWLQKNITRPILDISGVARNVVDSRDFSLRATKSTDDEIGALVDAFNATLAEIEQRTQALESCNLELAGEIANRTEAEQVLRTRNADLEERDSRRKAELESTNRELESFSYSISHDLRAPLRAIDGYARMVEEDYGDRLGDDGARMLAVVRGEAVRMGRLIDDLLSFSSMSRQVMEPVQNVDMTGLAKEVARSLMRGQDAERVRVEISPLPSVAGDVLLLRQVWMNLLSNALKYSGTKPKSEILVTGELRNGDALFQVQDNGVGFDTKYAAKLFGVFQRLHKAEDFDGTGVGLAIVHRVVTRHGGNVRADSTPGEGATFHFTLPAGSTHA
jgi:light-regulated signal transduction histidine kinase (bacteriophytochrome)